LPLAATFCKLPLHSQNMSNQIPSHHNPLAPATGNSRINREFWRITSKTVVAAVALVVSASGSHAEPAINTVTPAPLGYQADWRWVKGAVFVPTKDVNEAQQWDEYDPAIHDRELHHASVYGINCAASICISTST